MRYSHANGGILLFFNSPLTSCSALRFLQRSTYVNVRMKWKKDPFYDTLDVVNRSKELRVVISLKNIIARATGGTIPVSAVSKLGRSLEVHGRVAAFLRKFPAFFLEYPGPPDGTHPWFRLTPEAAAIDAEETHIYSHCHSELLDRLRRLVLMTPERRLPLQIVQGMQWFLGLPENFTHNLEEYSHGWFRQVNMGDGIEGLECCSDCDSLPLSTLQRTASDFLGGTVPEMIPFPLYPSKGVRLKRTIAEWVEGFQRLPYSSPYDHHHFLDPSSDVAEKRAVGILHELLCLLVDHSAERRKLLCLRKHLGLPQKMHRVFERHPHIFYLHLKNKTCTVVLKEAYHHGGRSVIEKHPLLSVREKYVELTRESEAILRRRRSRPRKNEQFAEISVASIFPQEKREMDGVEDEYEEEIDKCECDD